MLTVNTSPTEVLAIDPSAVSGQGWHDSGTTAYVDAVQNVVKVADESRYDFKTWTGAAPTVGGNQATVVMDGPKTATANYQLQYNITFVQSGVGDDFVGTIVTIDETNNYGVSLLPVSFWWDEHRIHSFAFQSPLTVGVDKQYVWTSTTGGLSSAQSDPSFKVTGSGSLVANYETELQSPPFTCVASVDPGSGSAPLTVQFAATPSGGVSPYSFEWAFGDGGSSTSQNPSHTYQHPGSYTWTLDASDSSGQHVYASGTIDVTLAQPPTETPPVGGVLEPVNKLAILTRHFALIVLAGAASTVFAIRRRRRAQAHFTISE